MNKIGFWDIILIIAGFIFIVFLLGYGAFSKTVEETKATLPENPLPAVIQKIGKAGSPCISLSSPDIEKPISFPVTISGTASGCGWEDEQGSIGTIVFLDANGQAVSNTYSMVILTKEGNTYTFSKKIYLNHTPTTSQGSILFRTLDQKNAYMMAIIF